MHKFWRSAAECLVASLALASLTVICDRLHLNLATTALIYVIVVVLVARAGNFVSAIVVAIVAALTLAYVAPPAFAFRIDDPLDEVAVITFLVISLTIAGLVSKLRRMNDEALSSVHRKLIDAEEREHTMIARELNEDINQRIALVAFGLEQLEQSPPKSIDKLSNDIRELWQRVSEIGADLHAISHRLRSSNLEYLGMVTSARNFCREFAEQQKVEIDFKSHDVASPLPLEISFQLFRVLQEALLNSVKHSGARHFEVELFVASGAIHLRVCDSGVGFDPILAMQGSGLGLACMRDRLKLVNGEFSIDSQSHRGTKIHAHVPLSSGGGAREQLGGFSQGHAFRSG